MAGETFPPRNDAEAEMAPATIVSGMATIGVEIFPVAGDERNSRASDRFRL
jgi:hypothetical protein